MGLTVSKFGQWTQAGAILQALSTNIFPAFAGKVEEDGKMVLETMQGHIDAQDLGWTPLSPHTVELKNGDSTIYVESGYLRDNLEVRRVRAPANGLTIFVGASAWKTHPSGVKFSDLMIWLEYGTDRIPPRPLIRPSIMEVEPLIIAGWNELAEQIMGGEYSG